MFSFLKCFRPQVNESFFDINTIFPPEDPIQVEKDAEKLLADIIELVAFERLMALKAQMDANIVPGHH